MPAPTPTTKWAQSTYTKTAIAQTSPRFFAVCELDGRTFRVDHCGNYDELIAIPLDDIELREPHQNMARVTLYAQWYNEGSEFPPISVSGTTPDHDTYALSNGHHRALAARLAGCDTIHGWACFYIDRGRDGRTCYMPARVSETVLGRRIAATLDISWCPVCGGVLNYHEGDCCESCRLSGDIERTRAYYAPIKERLGF